MIASFPSRLLALGLVAALAGACRSVRDLNLGPSVQDTELRSAPDALEARLIVAWRGLRTVEGGYEFRFRLRIENPADTPFTLVPAEFELLDANLASIGLQSPEATPVMIPASGSDVLELVFPVATKAELRAFDLTTLTLRMSLQAGRWNWSTLFRRGEVAYGEPWPWWGPTWHVSIGWAF